MSARSNPVVQHLCRLGISSLVSCRRPVRHTCRSDSLLARGGWLAMVAIVIAWLPATPAAAVSRTWFLDNGVTVAPCTDDPSIMTAKFTPAAGLSLQQAANMAGFDHFNWLQTIIQVPAGWTLQQVSKTGAASTLSTPTADPLQNSVDYKLQISTAAGTTSVLSLQAGFQDKNPCYWGEDWTKWWQAGNLYGTPSVATSSALFFADRPSFPSSIMAADDYVYFETKLVGVRADGTIDTLDDVAGTTFDWKTDAETDVAVFAQAIVGVIPDGNLPAVASGGVADAHIVTPEPCALALLSISAGCFLAFIWRRRTRAS